MRIVWLKRIRLNIQQSLNQKRPDLPEYSTTETRSNIVVVIHDHYHEFNETNKKIADYILQNLEKATFLSLADISKELGVSDATLVRFGKKLGFKGFLDLRQNLVEHIRKLIYPTQKASFMKDNDHPLLYAVLKKDIESMHNTISNIDHNEFDKLIELISSANRTFCMGWGYSSFLAEFLSFGLNLLSFKTITVIRERRPMTQQLLFITQSDVLIVFDLLLYSTEVQEAVHYARSTSKDIKIVTITNDSTAKIVSYSNLKFFFDLAGHEFQVISLTSAMCFINAIFEQLVLVNPKQTSKALQEFQRIVQLNPLHYSQFNPQSP